MRKNVFHTQRRAYMPPDLSESVLITESLSSSRHLRISGSERTSDFTKSTIYPWFAAVQPKIDWRRGWIDHTQLPIVFKAADAAKARFIPRTVNKPRPVLTERILLCKATIGTTQEMDKTKIPSEYAKHSKVFSEEKSQ